MRREAMVRDEGESDWTRNAIVADYNAPQTNSAVLSPREVERAFEFMLTLQAVAAVTDVPQRHRTLLHDCVLHDKRNPL